MPEMSAGVRHGLGSHRAVVRARRADLGVSRILGVQSEAALGAGDRHPWPKVVVVDGVRGLDLARWQTLGDGAILPLNVDGFAGAHDDQQVPHIVVFQARRRRDRPMRLECLGMRRGGASTAAGIVPAGVLCVRRVLARYPEPGEGLWRRRTLPRSRSDSRGCQRARRGGAGGGLAAEREGGTP